MDKRIKKLWVDALRSGEYQQGVGSLHRKAAGEDRFCCLGVLCDLAVKEKGVIQKIDELGDGAGAFHKYYDDASGRLPQSVKTWARLHSFNPIIKSKSISVAELNDNGTTFNQIADLIEEQL